MLGIGLGLFSLWQALQFFAAIAISLVILRWQANAVRPVRTI